MSTHDPPLDIGGIASFIVDQWGDQDHDGGGASAEPWAEPLYAGVYISKREPAPPLPCHGAGTGHGCVTHARTLGAPCLLACAQIRSAVVWDSDAACCSRLGSADRSNSKQCCPLPDFSTTHGRGGGQSWDQGRAMATPRLLATWPGANAATFRSTTTVRGEVILMPDATMVAIQAMTMARASTPCTRTRSVAQARLTPLAGLDRHLAHPCAVAHADGTRA